MDFKTKPPQHQVFINFRGDQLRHNFIGFLASSLTLHGINVFIDTCEHKGEDINHLFKRIDDSKIALVVFSSRYTESVWCLDELAKIKERFDLNKIKVLPIYYKVKPLDVKQLMGEFGEKFRTREWEYRCEKHKTDKWKVALEFISGKIGLTLDDKSPEIDFIELIVKEVLRMLKEIPTTQATNSQRTQHSQNTNQALEIKAAKTQPKDNTKTLYTIPTVLGHGKNTLGAIPSVQVPYPQCPCYICSLQNSTNQWSLGSSAMPQWKNPLEFGPDTNQLSRGSSFGPQWNNPLDYGSVTNQFRPQKYSFSSSVSFNGEPVSSSKIVWYPQGTTSNFRASESEDFPDYNSEVWNTSMSNQWRNFM
ncbi:unnamed protein product [Cochlearia groenlandica]